MLAVKSGELIPNVLQQIPVEDVKGIVPMDYDHYPGITPKTLAGVDCYTAAIWFQINGKFFLSPRYLGPN